MSLKYFHLFFISFILLALAFFAYWVQQQNVLTGQLPTWLFSSIVAFAAIIAVYLGYFIIKTKRL